MEKNEWLDHFLEDTENDQETVDLIKEVLDKYSSENQDSVLVSIATAGKSYGARGHGEPEVAKKAYITAACVFGALAKELGQLNSEEFEQESRNIAITVNHMATYKHPGFLKGYAGYNNEPQNKGIKKFNKSISLLKKVYDLDSSLDVDPVSEKIVEVLISHYKNK